MLRIALVSCILGFLTRSGAKEQIICLRLCKNGSNNDFYYPKWLQNSGFNGDKTHAFIQSGAIYVLGHFNIIKKLSYLHITGLSLRIIDIFN